MNASYNPLHIGNTYGLFGHITRERLEVIIEGTDDPTLGPATTWRAYEFKAKPKGADVFDASFLPPAASLKAN